MGVAHHAEYLSWFEVARTDWLRGPARDGRPERTYRQLEEAGYFLPVIAVRARYHSPARYDDEVVVAARLERASRVRFVFEYEARRRADDELLATGRSEHAVTDLSGRPCRLPETLFEWITGADDDSGAQSDERP